MILYLFVWCMILGALSWRAHAVPESKAKVVEEYVVAAKLDENKNFPQLQQRSQLRGAYHKDGMQTLPEPKNVSNPPISPATSHAGLKHLYHRNDYFDDRNILEDRDLLVHHHHLPPPAPPPLTSIGLHYAPSFFAIGLITFLLLLNSLQTSLLALKSKGSFLGSVTGALGRRKRFAGESVTEYGKYKLDFTPN